MGMVMPGILLCACAAIAALPAGFFAVALLAGAPLVAFFFAAGFAGIGMVMPGMDCAAADIGTEASAIALTAAMSFVFTIYLRGKTAPSLARRRRPAPAC